MKKTYITPELDVQLVQEELMIAGSIQSIGGNSNIGMGEGETPEEADVKADFYDQLNYD